MPRRSKADSEATAEAVLETATAMFAERGYADVGLEDVAAAAGVTRGAVYHHYSAKRALFERVLDRVQGEVALQITAAVAPVEDPWESLEVGCRTFLSASIDDRARRIVLVDAPALLGWQAWLGQDEAHSGRLLDDVLARLHRDGLLDVPSVPAAAALLSGAMNEAALWISGQADRDAALDQAWATLEILLRSLRRVDPGGSRSTTG